MSEWDESANRPEGYFQDDEGSFYKRVAERHPNGILVELGVHLGKSLSYVLPICRQLKIQVYAVDVWEDFCAHFGDGNQPNTIVAFTANLERMNAQDIVKIVKLDSVKAANQFADESVDIVHLDTFHTEHPTIEEIDAWWPKLKISGEMLFHDYFLDETKEQWAVRKVVDQKLGKPDEVHVTLASIRKTKH